MNIKRVLGCLILLMALAVNASAQLVAGSPQDRLYQQITAAADPAERVRLCLEFEQQFPDSDVLVDIYLMLMDVHNQRNEGAKVIEYGEKAIGIDAENVNALMAVARGLAVARRDLDKAVAYAERAVNATEKMKGEPPPPQYSPEQWQEYIQNTENAARSILSYARSIRG